jgi:hypothetical protein
MKMMDVRLAGLIALFLTSGVFLASEAAPSAEDEGFRETCSLSVGIVPRIAASYRTWANPFETDVLEREKGFRVCQDRKLDPVETGDATGPQCRNTEFHLEIRYRADMSTRNVRLSQKGRILFSKDYPGTPGSPGMLRTIPTCEQLAVIAAQPKKPTR